MNRFLVLLMICLTTTAVFAGCHEPTPAGDQDENGGTDGDQNGGEEPSAPSVTLTVVDSPEIVTAGESFNVTVRVEVSDDQTVTSAHSGAHYGFNSSADADQSDYTSILDQKSPHRTEEHSFTGTTEYVIVNWTIEEGHDGETVYFRAHIQSTEGVDYWSDENTFVLAPSA